MASRKQAAIGADDVFGACIERIIPSTLVGSHTTRCFVNSVQFLMQAFANRFVVKQQTYGDCWSVMTRWLNQQLELGNTGKHIWR